MHKQTAMLYTEETFIERGIEPLPIKHKQTGSALPKEYFLFFNLKEFRVRDFQATSGVVRKFH